MDRLRKGMLAPVMVVALGVAFVGASKPAQPPAASVPKPPPPKAAEVHEYKEQNISFTTPGSWTNQGQGCHGSFSVLTIPSKPFSYKPQPGKKDPPVPAANYGSCFIAATDPANDGKEIDAVIEAFQKEMQAAQKDITFTPTADATVAGESARTYIASYKMEVGRGDPAIARKEMAVFAAHGKKVYEFFMQASTPNFERDKQQLDRVLKSVKWLDAQAGQSAEKSAEK